MIVAFTSYTSLGATFMDWSWHWLKGEESYWSMKKGWRPIVKDPLKGKNAHGHPKNHPANFENWKAFIHLARRCIRNHGKDISFYPFVIPTRDNLSELNDYVNHINWMIVNRKVRVVVIKKTKEFPYGTERGELPDDDDNELPFGMGRNKLRYINSIQMAPQQKILLEQIDSALKLLDEDVIVVKDTEWRDHPESTIINICERLGTVIDPARLASWRLIMNRWSENFKKLEFFHDHEIPLIADRIVQGDSMDLEPFKLRLNDESLIIASIMKRHGRRLVLPDDDFPKNAKILHRFLR